MRNLILFLVVFKLVFASAQENALYKSDYFKKGKAEVSIYKLEQNRYQEIHPGKLVSIFVTEDFLIDKQVKNETYQSKILTWILKNIQLSKI
ncbi:MAG: hypothetical protein HC798_04855 [Polaribacter sp.]|nr:hypothetical protein [Polaribacter sp.]